MPVIANLERARGRAAPKLAVASKSVTGTGRFTVEEFGLSRIIAVLSANIVDAPATVPSQTVEVTAVTESYVDVTVLDHTTESGAEHRVSTTARTVQVVVVGE
jgi:hypothetical protein